MGSHVDSDRRLASASTGTGATFRERTRLGLLRAVAGAPAAPAARPGVRSRGGTAGVAALRRVAGRIPWSLLAYACLSIALFGHGVLGHLHTVVVGFGQIPAAYGRDQSGFVWFLAWGARALAHLQNPFITHEVFAPGGYNLAWSTSIIGPAIVLSPLTATIGAIPTFNLLVLSAPATSAWIAYLLCREFTVRRPSAFVGGLLFGFGTYESVEMINHLNLALTALVPLAALVVVRRARGRMARRRFVLALGATIGAQAWISTEVFASMTVLGALALAVAYATANTRQRRIVRGLLVDACAACALAAVIAAPYIWYVLTVANPLATHTTIDAGADLANFLVPTEATLLHIGVLAVAPSRLRANLTEQLGYVGIVIPLLLLAFGIENRRSWLGRTVLIGTLLAALLSLGGTLIIAGSDTGIPLPWSLIGRLPLLGFALPGRFSLYAWLGVGVMAAVWLDRPRRRALRWALVSAAIVSIAPNLFAHSWSTRVDHPQLLSSRSLARYVSPGSTVLALPIGVGGRSDFWQVQAGFSFRLAGGYLSWALPAGYRGLSIIHELNGVPPRAHLARRLCAFLKMTGARTILLRTHVKGDWAADLRPLNVSPVQAGGFLIYRVIPARCGRALRRSR